MRLPTQSTSLFPFQIILTKTLPPSPNQVFHTTPHTFALVNLKPLLPGHILICPLLQHQASSNPSLIPTRLIDLTPTQTSDLFTTVRNITPTLTRLYAASALNIAIQDGEAAGQSVQHLHVHVIPRREKDMDHRGGGDKLYEMLEVKGGEGDIGLQLWQHEQGRQQLPRAESVDGVKNGGENQKSPSLEERKPRSEPEMRAEAQMLRRELEKDGIFSTDPASISTPNPMAEAETAGRDNLDSRSDPLSTIDWRSILMNVAWIATGFGLANLYKGRNGSS